MGRTFDGLASVVPVRATFSWVAPLAVAALVAGCTRPNPLYLCNPDQRCQVMSEATLKTPTEQDEATVLEAADEIIIRQGSACTQAAKQPGKDRVEIVRLAGSSSLPSFVSQATVLLNGWRVQVLGGGDIRPAGVGAVITNVDLSGGTLTWDALGGFGDESLDDKYEWCYHYTVVGWNDSVIDARAHEVHRPLCVDLKDPVAGLFIQRTTISEPAIAGKRGVAVIPRGFTLIRDRAQLLRIAYNLDHAEALDWQGPVPQGTPQPESVVGSGFVSWDSKALFQNDDPDGALCLGDATALIAGDGVGVLQPPFSFGPARGPGFGEGCILDGALGTHTRDLVLKEVPFRYAVPMLTGWSLTYQCSDQEVSEAGAWIESFTYDKSGSTPGKLNVQVQSILRDRNGDNQWNEGMRLSVLGFESKPDLPDLVPIEESPDYCTRDAQGRLRIRIRNQGKDSVPIGTTARVTFQVATGPQVIDVPVPGPLSPGASVAIAPVPIPGRCFMPTCAFSIAVDAGDLVAESSEANNVAAGHCPG